MDGRSLHGWMVEWKIKIDVTHRSKNGHRLLAEPDGIEDVVMENRLKQVVFIIGLEGRLPGHHLVHQHPQSPPVYRGSVLELLQDLKPAKRHNFTRRTDTCSINASSWLSIASTPCWKNTNLETTSKYCMKVATNIIKRSNPNLESSSGFPPGLTCIYLQHQLLPASLSLPENSMPTASCCHHCVEPLAPGHNTPN